MQIKVRVSDDVNIEELNIGQTLEIRSVCRIKGDRYLVLECDNDKFFTSNTKKDIK